jgi:hypothetical protein
MAVPQTMAHRRKVLLCSYLGVSVHWPEVPSKRYSRHLNQSIEFAGRLGNENPGGNDAGQDANSIDKASSERQTAAEEFVLMGFSL